MSLKKILERTREYLWIPSVVRFERPFMECLADDFNVFGYDVELKDRVVAVTKHGTKSPRILTAHIDRNGIVTNTDVIPTRFEYAAFNTKKYYGDENKVPEAVFKEAGERFVGEEVMFSGERGKVTGKGMVKSFEYDFDKKNLSFEIEVLAGFPMGRILSYWPPYELVQNGRVSGQIDNAISVAVARQLIEDGFDGRVILATEEEAGRSWKHITDYLSGVGSSKEIVTLDTTSYNNERAIDEGLIVLRNKDSKREFNKDLVSRLKNICEQNGIRYEMKDEVIEAENAKGRKPKKLGITELGRIVEHTNGRFSGATVQLPTTNYHTNHETTSELAVKNYYEALLKILA